MASKNIKKLRADYEKAIKKEQALSSLLLVNLEKYKAAKAKGDEKAIATHTKIAGDLGKKKAKATTNASAAYKAYEDGISGLHSDAELQIDEVRKLIKKMIIKEAGVFDTGNEEEEDVEDSGNEEGTNANMAVKKFDMLLKGKPGWEKTKEVLTKLSDLKQTDFVLFLMNNLEVSDLARKKLKLKL